MGGHKEKQGKGLFDAATPPIPAPSIRNCSFFALGELKNTLNFLFSCRVCRARWGWRETSKILVGKRPNFFSFPSLPCFLEGKRSTRVRVALQMTTPCGQAALVWFRYMHSIIYKKRQIATVQSCPTLGGGAHLCFLGKGISMAIMPKGHGTLLSSY